MQVAETSGAAARYLQMFGKGKNGCLSTQSSNRNSLPRAGGGGVCILQCASSNHMSANGACELKGPYFLLLCVEVRREQGAHTASDGRFRLSFFFSLP